MAVEQVPDFEPPARCLSADKASFMQRITFNWVWPLLHKGNRTEVLEQADVSNILGEMDQAEKLCSSFENVWTENCSKGANKVSLFRLIFQLHFDTALKHAVLGLVVTVAHFAGPLLLREFIAELERLEDDSSRSAERAWILAAFLGANGLFLTVNHHQFFFTGMQFGYRVRTQMMAAIHSKVLRLNSKAISTITTGQMVNLVSNDVRKFDDALNFWVFLFDGPLELFLVVALLWTEIGFLATLLSTGTMLSLIPLQSMERRTHAWRGAESALAMELRQ
ncbi:hypothetical protein CYMTET_25021 [Cymbomonas tetramitiformis]|uniref:ABC transmembrane type-1 domain-containing protein n=1 Tax=Cymbomonas tetramitiformis TaxID=36881 RepID=A0AAE0FUL7_9CHLO|nr:hypothetical protein CYMTET_25021 [Cymbomonas tetramitiformis]